MANWILGMGRRESGDDAAGVVFAQTFRAPSWRTADVGTVPENAGGYIRRDPGGTVVLVDAVDLGLAPGSVRRVRADDLESAGFGTHAPDPSMLEAYLKAAGAHDVAWIGIQVASLARPGLSRPVKDALRRLARTLAPGPAALATLPWWSPALE